MNDLEATAVEHEKKKLKARIEQLEQFIWCMPGLSLLGYAFLMDLIKSFFREGSDEEKRS